MLYVGHFTFLGPDPEVLTDPTPRGWFALAAEAGSPEAAEDKFRELIENAKALTALFEDVATVWLDDLVEIKGLPEEGVVTHFHLSPDGDEPPITVTIPGVSRAITVTIPGVSREFCVAYQLPLPADGQGAEYPDERHEEPFVDFTEG